MRIVFDEILGNVAAPTEQDEKAQKAAAAPPATTPTTPKKLARDLRLIAERKARLHAC